MGIKSRELLIEFWIWFSVSVLLPIVFPLGFVWLSKLLIKFDKNLFGIFKMLWVESSAYVFLSLFVLISLLPHFFDKTHKMNRALPTLYVSVIVIVLLVTCFIFLSSLPIVSDISLKDNIAVLIGITIFGVSTAIGFKTTFLILQKNENQTKNQGTELPSFEDKTYNNFEDIANKIYKEYIINT